MSVMSAMLVLAPHLMMAIVWGTTALSSGAQIPVEPTVGDGLTADTAYQFTELGNLVWLEQQAAANATEGVYYKLLCDIDASPTATWAEDGSSATLGFLPIGQFLRDSDGTFRGIFDGNGFKITDLTVIRHTGIYVGLFGVIGIGGRVINLGVEGGTIAGDYCVGKLAGMNIGQISNCHASGVVTGNYYAGGLVGVGKGEISNSYSTGTVNGIEHIGGLTGYWHGNGTISNCYATGLVNGDKSVGGLIGSLTVASTVSFCYATCTVISSGAPVGGLIGNNYQWAVPDKPFYSDCFWDTQSSGMATSSGGIGKTTAEMNQQATFQPGGGTGAEDWDFTTVWDISPEINDGYPFLRGLMPKNGLSNWCEYE